MNRKTTVEASDLVWFKSSYSDGTDGNSCVELALTPRTIHVRDSKDVTGLSLTFTPPTWAHFIPYASEAR
ncbi:DUF397 domain-containing protein [Streptomyces lusitanus]|uniref:DUF397 domain-containing protein n=1 Tax=Streptomyces lusitanus TaxID=68232 RepID=A0ABU3JT48_9ACTN|nr:DUF397 domain-containing protein [Streptomyces lusitanus]